jgi:hypothetical protein
MAKLFGFKIEDTGEKKNTKIISPIPPNSEDRSDYYITSGFYGQYVDIEGVYKNEADLVRRYREMALHPECDSAIEDVVNEGIVSDLNDSPVEIELSNLNASDKLKEAIRREFKYIKEIMDFDKKAHEIFRNWYIDGRIYYHKVIDLKNPTEGIKEVRYIDPLKIKYIRKIKKVHESTLSAQVRVMLSRGNATDEVMNPNIEEYYLYDPNVGYTATQSNLNTATSAASKAVKLSKDSITYVTSGLVDRNRQTILSYLHKAIKSLNQLRMIEDSLVIYRLSRSSEKRIFYIDIGGLPRNQAEQYMKDVMNRYRNKLIYDQCLSLETRIPLLDGRILSLSKIIEEYDNGKTLWAYSCDPSTGKFAPGIISWAGITRRNEKVLKITLDNDESITCTLDHKFPVWNKGKVEAQNLIVGDSMIPFYTRNKSITSASKNSKYQQIYENETKKWIFTHRLVSTWKDKIDIINEYNYNPLRINEEKRTVHHKDYNRFNNSPENLTRMSKNDHFDYHKQHSSQSGKIGGKVCSQRRKEQGIPYINLTKEQMSENGKIYGKIGGKKSFENKSGIHGLSKDEIIKNSKKGSNKLRELLENNEEFRINYCNSISNGWKEKQRGDASIRAKKLPKEHFIKINKLANASRWYGEESNLQRINHSKKQTIEYTEQIFNLVEECVKNNYGFKKTINYVNENLNFEEWRELNSNKVPRKGKSERPLQNFNYRNLTNVCKNLGFNSWKDYKNSFVYKNHKIKSIELLENAIDVGTLTIDRNETYHNYHTFALESGIYTCNSTGEVKDDRKYMAMMEDYWLPRRDGGKGTEVQTLPGGQNLGELSDLEYFQKKLYKSLGVPSTRLDAGGGFNLGRSSEILRDELKFTRFVGRLRKRFSQMFTDMLKTQLILKNIVSVEDWDKLSDHIQYDFLYDNHFADLKKNEILNDKLGVIAAMEPYLGRYFSVEYVRKNVLGQTDTEMIDIDKQIKKEIKDGILPDPNAMPPMDAGGGIPPQQGAIGGQTLGAPVKEPGVSGADMNPPTMGEI